MKNNNNKLHL